MQTEQMHSIALEIYFLQNLDQLPTRPSAGKQGL